MRRSRSRSPAPSLTSQNLDEKLVVAERAEEVVASERAFERAFDHVRWCDLRPTATWSLISTPTVCERSGGMSTACSSTGRASGARRCSRFPGAQPSSEGASDGSDGTRTPIRERQRRSEDYQAEFEVDFGSLTDEEQAEFIALVRQRTARAAEVVAAIEENVRILKLLIGWEAGVMTTLEFVERVRGAVPDTLA